ncbi:hypothetical protein HNQ34_001147 [Anoxybacillus tepidamans]|uniref:YwdI n=1 Tax=Anoxybacteroides tepidamans TaxID=265948 RepID=A0A7W8IP28_9BACL|nr:YwdI family protein [Anoxybacillus tepidamans]MBB5324055.1 hypothetical protein [Anoxybacillus tepidamans]
MDVSVTTILAKMAALVQKAQTSDVRQMREHIAAVRVLCDLILEEEEKPAVLSSAMPEIPPLAIAKERIDIGDDANGSSLLDF